jgi:hypothetical protein
MPLRLVGDDCPTLIVFSQRLVPNFETVLVIRNFWLPNSLMTFPTPDRNSLFNDNEHYDDSFEYGKHCFAILLQLTAYGLYGAIQTDFTFSILYWQFLYRWWMIWSEGDFRHWVFWVRTNLVFTAVFTIVWLSHCDHLTMEVLSRRRNIWKNFFVHSGLLIVLFSIIEFILKTEITFERAALKIIDVVAVIISCEW